MIVIGYVPNGTDTPRTITVHSVADAVECINSVRLCDTLTFAGVAASARDLVAIALMSAR
jgi:hypothetical protein